MPNTILGKIILGLTSLTVLAIGIVMVALAIQFQSTAAVLQDRGLYEVAMRIAGQLRVGTDGNMLANLEDNTLAILEPRGAFSYTVSDISGAIVNSSEPGRDSALHPFDTHIENRIGYFEHSLPHQANEDHGAENYYGINMQIDIGGTPYWIQVAEETDQSRDFTAAVTRMFLEGAGWIIIPFFAATIILNILLIRWSFRPLHQAADRVEMIRPDARGEMLEEARLPEEIRPFARTINAAFREIDQALKAQKEFVAEAAHELLTPLAVMQARLDTLQLAEGADKLRDDVKEISGTVHQLLELAELEANQQPPRELVDLRQVAQEVVDNLAPISATMGKSVVLTGTTRPVYVHGHHRAIARAIRNLVDNGLAVSPDNGSVTIDVSDEPAVRVIDNGPGIPLEERDLVFHRHWRGRGRPSGHSGLGLAIVARIVNAHEGEVDIGGAPDGGAVVTIRLPRVDEG